MPEYVGGGVSYTVRQQEQFRNKSLSSGGRSVGTRNPAEAGITESLTKMFHMFDIRDIAVAILHISTRVNRKQKIRNIRKRTRDVDEDFPQPPLKIQCIEY